MKPTINRSAQKVLVPIYGKSKVNALLRQVWEGYNMEYHDAPKEKTLGARIMVGLGVISVVFYIELLSQLGATEQTALAQFNQIAWVIYKKMGRIAYFLSGIGAKNNYAHLKRAISLFRTFPFGNPSYQWRDLPSDPDSIDFNCERCPVANYFQEKNLAHLGYQTWCRLDFQLAELWGGSLELTNTIAGGAEICDFKWKVNEPATIKNI